MTEQTNDFIQNSDLDFVRDVLVDALDQRRDNLIGDLFDLYNKIRKKEVNSSNDFSFTTTGYPYMDTTKDTVDFLNNNIGDIRISTTNSDVISFGDYTA